MRYQFFSFFLLFLIISFCPRQLSAADGLTSSSNNKVEPSKSVVSETNSEIPFPLTAYIQFWYAYEEVENSKKQEVTGDKASDVSSGFSLNKARLEYEKVNKNYGGRLSVRFDGGTPGLLDAYGYYRFPEFHVMLSAGQMKFPSTYEVAQKDTDLDFVTRSTFSNEVVNWSLSKSPSSVSPFNSVQSQSRDTGIGITAEDQGLKLFIYAGNGIGANMFVGAEEKKQIVYSNSLGDMFYGARCDADILRLLPQHYSLLNKLNVGGHISNNNHDNFLYNDTRTVLDMERYSWSADIHFSLYDRIHFTAMSGGGTINDNLVDSEKKPNVTYKGYEIKLMGDIIPGFIRFGYRFDSYTYANKIFGGYDKQLTHTAGFSIWPISGIKIIANYKWKITEGDLNPDLDDNIFIIQTQFIF